MIGANFAALISPTLRSPSLTASSTSWPSVSASYRLIDRGSMDTSVNSPLPRTRTSTSLLRDQPFTSVRSTAACTSMTRRCCSYTWSISLSISGLSVTAVPLSADLDAAVLIDVDVLGEGLGAGAGAQVEVGGLVVGQRDADRHVALAGVHGDLVPTGRRDRGCRHARGGGGRRRRRRRVDRDP